MKRGKHLIWLMTVWTLVLALALPAVAANKSVILATTTSTQDSGLLDLLVPVFEKDSGYSVKTIAVGSGQAMAMGKKGRPMCCWCIHPMRKRPSWRKGPAAAAGW